MILIGRIAGHPHIAAERKDGDTIVSVAASETEEPLSESEREDEHADFEELRDDKMPRFVREDQESKSDDEGENIRSGNLHKN